MKRFEFSLQKVHDLRRQAEREALGSLGGALAHLEGVEARLESLFRARGRIEAELEEHLASGAIDSRRIQVWHGELAQTEGFIAEARKERTVAWRGVERAQEAAQSCRAERRATDNLKERALANHELDVRRQEQLDMDEVASIQHTRKGRAT